jgi:hypothetical protein
MTNRRLPGKLAALAKPPTKVQYSSDSAIPFSGAISSLSACIANQFFSFQEHRGNDLLPARRRRGLVFLFPGSRGRANDRETKLHSQRAGSRDRLHHSLRENERMRTSGRYYRDATD